LFENFQKKKTVRRGRTKRRRVESLVPNHRPQNNTTVVVIDSDEDEYYARSNVENNSINVANNTVGILPTNVHSLPGIYAAMNAISQNKKLRSEIRKSFDPQLSEEPLDLPAKAESSTSDNVLFSVYSSSAQPHIKFRLLKTDGFEKLSQAFCSCNKYPPDSGVLKWYGITLDKKQTPIDFDMSGEERVDFVFNSEVQKTPAQHELAQELPKNVNPTPSVPNHNPAVANDAIVLKLRRGENIQKFRIKKTDNVRKLIGGYCTRQKLDSSKVSLRFDGRPLSPSETPNENDMEDDDLIDVEIS